ncbi:MAG: hypothetical protein EXR72_01440 [Myxococcales bacterium]|nr:hypothetical protein [Myxococcales bacterium]
MPRHGLWTFVMAGDPSTTDRTTAEKIREFLESLDDQAEVVSISQTRLTDEGGASGGLSTFLIYRAP